MKKIFVLAVTAVAMMSLALPCNAQKKSNKTARITGEVAVAEDPCDAYAAEAPAVRKTGVATHAFESTANNLAEMQARASFAASIEAAIMLSTELTDESMTQYAGDDEEGRSVMDASQKTQGVIKSVASQVVKNTHPVKKTRYKKTNNQWVIHVCIEYIGSEDEMADQIIKSLEEKLSPDARKTLEDRHNEVKRNLLENLNQ